MSIYNKFDSAFSDASVYAVMKDGEIVGRICFKIRKSGTVTAFVHEWGFEMISGLAGGYGYDKKRAALCDAVSKVDDSSPLYQSLKGVTCDGQWKELLRGNGYSVQCII